MALSGAWFLPEEFLPDRLRQTPRVDLWCHGARRVIRPRRKRNGGRGGERDRLAASYRSRRLLGNPEEKARAHACLGQRGARPGVPHRRAGGPMKPPLHDASARQHSGEPSSGLGPVDIRKDRLRNRDLAELESCEIAGLVDPSTQELRRVWPTLYHSGPPLGLSRDLIIRGLADKLQQRAHGNASRAFTASPSDYSRRVRERRSFFRSRRSAEDRRDLGAAVARARAVDRPVNETRPPGRDRRGQGRLPPAMPLLWRPHDHRRELRTRRRISRPAFAANRGRDRNAMTPITGSSQLLATGNLASGIAPLSPRRLRSHLLHLPSGQNRSVHNRRDDDPGTSIVDPTPTTPASASPTQTAAPTNPHR
jgi:hypothetical protein